jgi:septal ring factor EnvC (AmiA/AmiB activator)
MRSPIALAALALGFLAVPAHGQVTEIYKCLDSAGRPLYTSDKRDTVGKKCETVSREANVVPAPGRRASGFPRESARDSAAAKDRQRDLLQQELANEQQALDRARQELASEEATRSGDEKNYARVLERLQPLKDTVENHERNIAALRRELSNLYR